MKRGQYNDRDGMSLRVKNREEVDQPEIFKNKMNSFDDSQFGHSVTLHCIAGDKIVVPLMLQFDVEGMAITQNLL